MMRSHNYDVTVSWTGDRGTGTSGYRDYDRDHDVIAEGPEPILGSSDPAFRGDKTRWNPEQLLVASLSQCHMLWYLHLAAEAGVVVTEYVDNAVGSMTESGKGGQFTGVVLRPRITVTDQAMVDTATRLHDDAHHACYIANSVNFPVTHSPTITVDGGVTKDQP